MGSEAEVLHMLFFPLMAPGHMIPMVDMAKLFAARGARITILTTRANATLIQGIVDRANESTCHPIQLLLIQFPSVAAGLPEGCENLANIPLDRQSNFLKGLSMLRQPFDQVLRDLLPDCVLTDTFMPWTFDVSSDLGIPRLVFHGTSFFSLCVGGTLGPVVTRESLPADGESFIVPGLPHRIEMLKSQIFHAEKPGPSGFLELFKKMAEVDVRSHGAVMNSFYELEPDYAEHFRKVMGRRAWGIGPVSLCNRDIIDMSTRGEKAAIGYEDCLNWLHNKKPQSVVFVCFGSLCKFPNAQIPEIALALEASGHPFIWVVNRSSDTNAPELFPEGYEERIGAKGLIIRGWAPQILILNHPAVGGFVTHCGWNSTLEAVSAGVPMVTWPLFAEQFYNERLVVDVLRIGVAIGIKEYAHDLSNRPLVKAAEIEMALSRMMGGGEEARAMKKRAEELGEMAKKAVDEGGSAYIDMGNLIQELLHRKCS